MNLRWREGAQIGALGEVLAQQAVEILVAPPLPGRIRFGEGMNAVLSEETVEHIVNSTLPGDNEDAAAFKFDSIAMAEAGMTISGDDV